jgi:hypothetical protein
VIRATRGIASTLAGLEEDALALEGYLQNQFGSSLGLNSGPQSTEGGGMISNISYQDQTEGEKLEAASFNEELKRWAQGIRFFSAYQRSLLLTNLGGEIEASVQVRIGQDLRDIAAEQYGSPFEWRRLLTFNDLDSVEVNPGQVIYVPRSVPEDIGQPAPGI